MLTVFAALFASYIHDLDDPGFTNQHLINTSKKYLLSGVAEARGRGRTVGNIHQKCKETSNLK